MAGDYATPVPPQKRCEIDLQDRADAAPVTKSRHRDDGPSSWAPFS
jgi:hypothetical protein